MYPQVISDLTQVPQPLPPASPSSSSSGTGQRTQAADPHGSPSSFNTPTKSRLALAQTSPSNRALAVSSSREQGVGVQGLEQQQVSLAEGGGLSDASHVAQHPLKSVAAPRIRTQLRSGHGGQIVQHAGDGRHESCKSNLHGIRRLLKHQPCEGRVKFGAKATVGRSRQERKMVRSVVGQEAVASRQSRQMR